MNRNLDAIISESILDTKKARLTDREEAWKQWDRVHDLLSQVAFAHYDPKLGVLAARYRALFLEVSEALHHWQERAGIVTAIQLIEQHRPDLAHIAVSEVIGPADADCPKCGGKRRLEKLLWTTGGVTIFAVCPSCGHSEDVGAEG